jgi:hypothetical protein
MVIHFNPLEKQNNNSTIVTLRVPLRSNPSDTSVSSIAVGDPNTGDNRLNAIQHVGGSRNEDLEDDQWEDLGEDIAADLSKEHLPKYRRAEYLAHQWIYQRDLPLSGEIIITEEDGTKQKYCFNKLQGINHAGLIGYILTPKTVAADQVPDFKIVFRGTKIDQSIGRDLEHGGAGARSFADNQQVILQEINDAIEQFNLKQPTKEASSPVSLTIAGHSLGGADAQNCLIAVMDGICNNLGLKTLYKPIPLDSVDHFGCINRLRAFVFNSAGIPQENATKSIALAKQIYDVREVQPVDLQSYNLLVVGDGIQQTGQAHILNDVPQEHAQVMLLKVTLPGYGHNNPCSVSTSMILVGGAYWCLGPIGALAVGGMVSSCAANALKDTSVAHRVKLFDTNNLEKEIQYEIICNNKEERAMLHNELQKKNGTLNFFQNILTSTINSISDPLSILQSTPEVASTVGQAAYGVFHDPSRATGTLISTAGSVAYTLAEETCSLSKCTAQNMANTARFVAGKTLGGAMYLGESFGSLLFSSRGSATPQVSLGIPITVAGVEQSTSSTSSSSTSSSEHRRPQ